MSSAVKAIHLHFVGTFFPRNSCLRKSISHFHNELLFGIIQSNLIIVFVSRIFDCRYFSHGLFTNTWGNYVAIENDSTFFLSDTDFFSFQLLFQHYGQFFVSDDVVRLSAWFVCHLYVLLLTFSVSYVPTSNCLW